MGVLGVGAVGQAHRQPADAQVVHRPGVGHLVPGLMVCA
jgi:hypothetical protein